MNRAFIFVLGAAAGSLVTWKILDEKYKQIVDEEVEAVVEYYREKEEAKERIVECKAFDEKIENPKWSFEGVEVKHPNMSLEDYNNQIKDLEYSDGEVEEKEDDLFTVKVESAEEHIIPYVISPEEFGEAYGYETKSYTYYADGVLTDEVGEIVVDPDMVIGDGLEHFGDYEEDSVFVRNDNTECDYEILKHEKAFSEINGEDN